MVSGMPRMVKCFVCNGRGVVGAGVGRELGGGRRQEERRVWFARAGTAWDGSVLGAWRTARHAASHVAGAEALLVQKYLLTSTKAQILTGECRHWLLARQRWRVSLALLPPVRERETCGGGGWLRKRGACGGATWWNCPSTPVARAPCFKC